MTHSPHTAHPETVTLLDRTFALTIPETRILRAVHDLAARIDADIAGTDPLFLVVLNGAFIFASDLLKRITTPAQVSFIRLASYSGTTATGTVDQVIGLTTPVAGRHIVIIEDIIDTGLTMTRLTAQLRRMGAATIRIATLLHKPQALLHPLHIDYIALTIPNDFIVGYGLDYDGYGRNLPDIYTIL